MHRTVGDTEAGHFAWLGQVREARRVLTFSYLTCLPREASPFALDETFLTPSSVVHQAEPRMAGNNGR